MPTPNIFLKDETSSDDDCQIIEDNDCEIIIDNNNRTSDVEEEQMTDISATNLGIAAWPVRIRVENVCCTNNYFKCKALTFYYKPNRFWYRKNSLVRSCKFYQISELILKKQICCREKILRANYCIYD